MNVLVTGVTGKSGLYFYNHLKTNGIQNIKKIGFIVRDKQKAKRILDGDFNQQLHIGNIDDPAFIADVINTTDYDTILHIAGIQKSLALVKTALNSNIKRFILVHTTGIYSKYKAAGENYRLIESQIESLIEGKNISLTILRPTMIYGTLDDHNISVFIKMVDKLRIFPIVSGAKFELQPVWCGDLGRAYYDVLMNPQITNNKNYILSGGSPIMLLDIFKIIAQKLEVKNYFINVPFPIAYGGAWFLYIFSFTKIDFREKVQRLVEPRVYGHEEAAKDFHYNPVSFEIGINQEIEDYKASSIRK